MVLTKYRGKARQETNRGYKSEAAQHRETAFPTYRGQEGHQGRHELRHGRRASESPPRLAHVRGGSGGGGGASGCSFVVFTASNTRQDIDIVLLFLLTAGKLNHLVHPRCNLPREKGGGRGSIHVLHSEVERGEGSKLEACRKLLMYPLTFHQRWFFNDRVGIVAKQAR